MSTLKCNAFRNTASDDGGIDIDASGHVQIDGQQLPSAGALSNRNLVINGGMAVWQRGTASTTVTSSTRFLADRFKSIESTDGAMTQEQSTDAPDGFAYSLELDVTTADTTLAADQYTEIDYNIEAQDLQSLKYGSNAAESITLSFWVKSSKTGTYCVQFQKRDTTRYNFVKEYTISAANTWEKKTITVDPDSNIKASGGAIVNDNGTGIRITFCLAMGSTYNGATDGVWSSNTNHFATSNQVNWMDSTSNDFYLTGVQLEIGEKATPFEHRSYGDELARCQRYYVTIADGNNKQFASGAYYVAGIFASTLHFPVTMRAVPTLDYETGTGYYRIWSNGTFDDLDVLSTVRANINSAGIDTGTGTSGTQGYGGVITTVNNSSYVAFTAEL